MKITHVHFNVEHQQVQIMFENDLLPQNELQTAVKDIFNDVGFGLVSCLPGHHTKWTLMLDANGYSNDEFQASGTMPEVAALVFFADEVWEYFMNGLSGKVKYGSK